MLATDAKIIGSYCATPLVERPAVILGESIDGYCYCWGAAMIMRSFSKVDSDSTILTTEVTTINLNCNR